MLVCYVYLLSLEMLLYGFTCLLVFKLIIFKERIVDVFVYLSKESITTFSLHSITSHFSFSFLFTGGTLRIFGESLNKDVAYKTLLLSTENTAAHVVREILQKYDKNPDDAPLYCLVQLIVPHNITDINTAHELNGGSGIREYILDDDDCPLVIEKNHIPTRGALSFHIKRRPADYVPRKRKKKPSQSVQSSEPDTSYSPRVGDSNEKLSHLDLNTNADSSETNSIPMESPALRHELNHSTVPVLTQSENSTAPAQDITDETNVAQSDGPETQVIMLQKSSNGMGLSIVATKGMGCDKAGIYIKTVVKGGAAEMVSFNYDLRGIALQSCLFLGRSLRSGRSTSVCRWSLTHWNKPRRCCQVDDPDWSCCDIRSS